MSLQRSCSWLGGSRGHLHHEKSTPLQEGLQRSGRVALCEHEGSAGTLVTSWVDLWMKTEEWRLSEVHRVSVEANQTHWTACESCHCAVKKSCLKKSFFEKKNKSNKVFALIRFKLMIQTTWLMLFRDMHVSENKKGKKSCQVIKQESTLLKPQPSSVWGDKQENRENRESEKLLFKCAVCTTGSSTLNTG